MKNVYDTLLERGYIAQTTHEQEIKDMLANESVTFYIGFDATADSLTAGHFLTIMAMMHMQRAGHRPIALLGGGTTMIGDRQQHIYMHPQYICQHRPCHSLSARSAHSQSPYGQCIPTSLMDCCILSLF